MYRFLCDALRRMGRDERGNVFILFGACAIPLLLIMGGAVDIARYTRYKADLSIAVDAAALALARQHYDYTAAEAKTFVTNYVNALSVADSAFTISNIDVTKLSNGFHVSATGSMTTTFLPLGTLTKSGNGISSLDASIVAEVVNSSNRLELALVFDNTGSMNCGNSTSGCDINDWSSPPSSSRIVALKAAAHTLVNTLMPTGYDPAFIKIGLVPFEGAVNIGSTYAATPPAWVEWNDVGSAKYDGANFGKRRTDTGAACTSGATCKPVGHKWLFNKLTAKNSSVKWEGCVEMRAEPYDISDTTPAAATANTLFVPYFWPDEPDSNSTGTSSPNTKNNNNGDSYTNDYLKDKVNFSGDPSGAQKSWTKYFPSSNANNITFQSGAIDTTFPFENGPNFGCPKPIVPLTSTKTTVDAAIDAMVAYYSTGTYIPTGLVWGWHLVSPTEPFTQGVAPSDPNYAKTVKAIVLFTDGENFVTGEDNHNHSRFSAYNYIAQIASTYRLDDDNTGDAMDALDTKTAALCGNVKTNGTVATTDDIRVYTITFGSMSSSDEDLMRNCATVSDGEPLYYHAPTTSDLEDIFEAIGEDLSDIHLSM